MDFPSAGPIVTAPSSPLPPYPPSYFLPSTVLPTLRHSEVAEGGVCVSARYSTLPSMLIACCLRMRSCERKGKKEYGRRKDIAKGSTEAPPSALLLPPPTPSALHSAIKRFGTATAPNPTHLIDKPSNHEREGVRPTPRTWALPACLRVCSLRGHP